MPNSSLFIRIFNEVSQQIEAAEISIYNQQMLIAQKKSSLSEATEFILESKPKENSLDPFSLEPYASYDIEVIKDDIKVHRYDIRVFEGINSYLDIVLVNEYA